jgi:NAD(P)-dependent dehydrogenase (short-subunit alcohol dehydrogenase family)
VLAGPDHISYAVSKGVIRQLTNACALALAPCGVRVNAIGPGTIKTDMAAAALKIDDPGILARTPRGRLGEPAEIAAVAAFLASHDASYISGQTLYADGGRLGLNYTIVPAKP